MRSSRKLAARYWDGSRRTRKSASRFTSSCCTYRLAEPASSAAETLELMDGKLADRTDNFQCSGPLPDPLAEQPFLAAGRRQAGVAGARVQAARAIHVPEPQGIAPRALEAPAQIGEVGIAVLIIVVEINQQGRHALPVARDLARLGRKRGIESVAMGREILAGCVVQH